MVHQIPLSVINGRKKGSGAQRKLANIVGGQQVGGKCSCLKLSLKNAKFEIKTTIFEKFKAKIEILNIHNILCQKCAVSVRKLQLPLMYFLNLKCR